MADAEAFAPRSRRGRDLIDYLTNAADYPYARLEAVDTSGLFDFIDIVVEPQLPQDRTVAIRNEEQVRLAFWPDDELPPSIYSRRTDFPLDLVHTNYDASADGRCLCVWEENWPDLKRGLSAQALIERIRDWFTRTARSELHQPGQPLEPLLPASADCLIIPPGPPPATWHVGDVLDHHERRTLLLSAEPPPGGPRFVPLAIFSLEMPPQVHGALQTRRRSLQGLHDLLAGMGADLLGALGQWIAMPAQLAQDRPVLMLIAIPKRANAAADIEAWEVLAFSPVPHLHELSELLGRASRDPESGRLAPLLTAAPPQDLDQVKLSCWRVVQRLDRAAARLYAGNPAEQDARLVGIGAGAIGSNVMANSMRAGIGTWITIDDDVQLPHNGVRQAQDNTTIGKLKAESMAHMLNATLAEGGSSHINANVLNPGEQEQAVGQALESADLVIDFSASPAVLGRIADDKTIKRAASFFFNPDGSDLVVLAEDSKRALRLDEIEAQYFLIAAIEATLANHLDAARIDLVRYANACQDLTRPLPPWQVQALSGIAAGQLISLLQEKDAVARVWRLDPVSGSIQTLILETTPVRTHDFADFRVTVSDEVIQTMRRLRKKAAPNETGGVFLGSFDLARRVVHIVAALPAPPDSRQSPTYFIRGAKHLKPLVDGINASSAGTISYLGEWHSHPDRARARPSDDDEDVYAHLNKHLDPTGAPYVMAICGDKETWIRASWHGLETSEGVMRHGRK